MDFLGISQVHKNAVLIEKGKQLYLDEARRRAGGLSLRHSRTLQATVRFLGTSERMSSRRDSQTAHASDPNALPVEALKKPPG
jgi:hypothetical protein